MSEREATGKLRPFSLFSLGALDLLTRTGDWCGLVSGSSLCFNSRRFAKNSLPIACTSFSLISGQFTSGSIQFRFYYSGSSASKQVLAFFWCSPPSKRAPTEKEEFLDSSPGFALAGGILAIFAIIVALVFALLMIVAHVVSRRRSIVVAQFGQQSLTRFFSVLLLLLLLLFCFWSLFSVFYSSFDCWRKTTNCRSS